MSPTRLPDAQRDLELHPLQGLLRLSPHALRRHRLFLKASSPANIDRLGSTAASYSQPTVVNITNACYRWRNAVMTLAATTTGLDCALKSLKTSTLDWARKTDMLKVTLVIGALLRPRNWNQKMKGKIMLCTICFCLLRS
jgi:hypothetical protein